MRLRSVVSDGGASEMHGTVEVLFRASTFPLSRDIVSTFLLSELVLQTTNGCLHRCVGSSHDAVLGMVLRRTWYMSCARVPRILTE